MQLKCTFNDIGLSEKQNIKKKISEKTLKWWNVFFWNQTLHLGLQNGQNHSASDVSFHCKHFRWNVP